jgi:hypothetical protein
MSQNKEIKHYLNSGYSITPLEALKKFGCMRLAAVIYDLKNEGMLIGTETITSDNGKRFAKYYALQPQASKNQYKLF